MYLTASNLPHYLIARGLITAESVVRGDFVLVETGRRNRNFKILRESAPGLFVKQIKDPDAQAIATLEREGLFYTRLRPEPALTALRAVTPDFVDYDARRHSLIIRLLDGYESVADYHRRIGTIPVETGQLLGECLAECHEEARKIRPEIADRKLFPCEVPWIMKLQEIGYTVLQNYGATGERLAALLQLYPAFTQRLSGLQREWQVDSLSHGDMKWENCLLAPGEEGAPMKARIIDWELVDLGDGAWDAASILKEYVMAWLLAASNGIPSYTSPAGATLPVIQAGARAFWKAYADRRGLTGAARAAYLDRTVRFCAARMAVAVLEYLYGAPQLTGLMQAMLQVASSILEQPDAARTGLFGMETA